MDSIINIVAIFLFIVIVYAWASNFHHTHKHHKKIYTLEEPLDDIEGFVVGGQNNTNACNPNPCKNNGSCVLGKNIVDGITYDYSCKCNVSSGIDSNGVAFSGRSYSGYNCEYVNDESLGVGVKLLDNIDEIKMPITYEKEAMFEQGNNTWNDYL